MAKTTSLAANLSLYSVRSRLAQFLIDLAERPQSGGGWTQDEIAAHIGTVRDVVGRLLREFESQGLIERNRQNIILLDHEALISEAQNDDA
jgi:CRP-like cAMP-binding protein